MLDIKYILENKELVKTAVKNKGMSVDIDLLEKAYEDRCKLIEQTDELRAKKNTLSAKIPSSSDEEKKTLLEEAAACGKKLDEIEPKLKEAEESYKHLLLDVPNIPAEDVPVGKDESENIEIKTWGEIPSFAFKPKSHIELGKELDIIDFEAGVKIAGSRSYILKGDGARLEMALMHYAEDFITNKGFSILSVPVIVKEEMMYGTGFFPGGEDQTYKIPEDNLVLVGTSEVPIMGYFQDTLLEEAELPKKYAGYSTCFRREAGTYGKDTAGLYRVHQFQKVEQTIVCKADLEESRKQFEFLRSNTEEILQSLNIPYRILNVCTGDLGKKNVVMHDIESWMPSRDSYGETHSCSILHDFQARRLNLKYKDENGKKHFCHTLNNTVLASPRILIPILELNQNEDGSITIPDVLRPYMQGQEKITRA